MPRLDLIDLSIVSIVRLQARKMLMSMPNLLAITFKSGGHIQSKHPNWSFTNNAIIIFMYRPYSNVSSFCSPASRYIRFGLPPHCLVCRPAFLAFCINFRANRILSAVLKSASTKLMIHSWWLWLTPGFYSNITSTLLVHRLLTKPYWKGRLIMIHSYSAKSSCLARHFQIV